MLIPMGRRSLLRSNKRMKCCRMMVWKSITIKTIIVRMVGQARPKQRVHKGIHIVHRQGLARQGILKRQVQGMSTTRTGLTRARIRVTTFTTTTSRQKTSKKRAKKTRPLHMSISPKTNPTIATPTPISKQSTPTQNNPGNSTRNKSNKSNNRPIRTKPLNSANSATNSKPCGASRRRIM